MIHTWTLIWNTCPASPLSCFTNTQTFVAVSQIRVDDCESLIVESFIVWLQNTLQYKPHVIVGHCSSVYLHLCQVVKASITLKQWYKLNLFAVYLHLQVPVLHEKGFVAK